MIKINKREIAPIFKRLKAHHKLMRRNSPEAIVLLVFSALLLMATGMFVFTAKNNSGIDTLADARGVSTLEAQAGSSNDESSTAPNSSTQESPQEESNPAPDVNVGQGNSGQSGSNPGSSNNDEPGPEENNDPPASNFCSSFPSLPSQQPTASNTGVPAGTNLTPSGSMTITTAGTTINAMDVTGDITVAANNVTIKNSKIHQSGWSAAKGVIVNDGVTGTKILHSEIYTDNGGYIGIDASNTIVCGSYIHGWENGMTVGGNMTIQANYLDKLASSQAGPHWDGIEVYYGGSSDIWGNNIRLTDTSNNWLGDTGAINLTAWTDPIDNVDIRGNWLGGGGYSLYVDEQSGIQATNITVVNNRWYRNTSGWGTHTITDYSSVTSWSGNVFDDDNSAISK